MGCHWPAVVVVVVAEGTTVRATQLSISADEENPRRNSKLGCLLAVFVVWSEETRGQDFSS